MSTFQTIITGGAPLQASVIEDLRRVLDIKSIKQFYTATESGTVTTTPVNCDKISSIGTLIPGVEVKVVDPQTGQALGPHQVGEVYVRGLQVTPGYYKNPEATGLAFSEDGFYKTGDACYYDEEGLFYITDRYKELIKVDSQQVAPKELENLLLEHQSVAEVAVIGIPDKVRGQVPKAYVVLKPGHEGQVSDSDLKDYVKGEVAEWKQLRGGIEFVSDLPKISIGKIDKNLLRNREVKK
jgi:acyl-CoA synthetase (AMP-forming)/AMP-acid ligase II